MNDQDQSQEQSVDEMAQLRRRVAELEAQLTRSQQAEDELRRSEARLRSVVDNAPVQVTTVDHAGTILFINRPAPGLNLEDVIGRSVYDFLQPEHCDQGRQCIEHVFRSGEMVVNESMATGPHGTRSWYETRLGPVKLDGQVVAVTLVSSDITEQKRAEEELTSSRAMLRAAIDSLPFEFFAIGPDGRYMMQNAIGEGHAGQLIGKRPGDACPDERTLAIWLDNNRRAFAGEKVEGEIAFPVGGECRCFHNIIAPIREGERILGILGVNVDITDRKRAERQLQEANDRLEQRVRERTAELTTANELLKAEVQQRRQAEERLKQEQQALRHMVLAIDHERRLITYELHDGVAQQLLGAKMLFESQQSLKGRRSKGTDAYRGAMEALTQATAELRRVMNRLRTPVLDRFGPVEAIKDVASQLRSTAGAPEIEYHPDVRFERLEPTLENSLFRIAQEAMTNACRYSRSEKVRVTLTQEGDRVTLEVRDWGIGFDQAAVQENRFGLEGIRERSRLLGGTLSIESEQGQGTVIRVTLPVIEAAEEE